jgi:hypothetical protein
MLAFPAAMRIYLAVEPVDMRKSFNGLWAVASEKLKEDPKSGAVFGFTNKKRNRLKLLYWDTTGVWVLAKTHIPQCPHWFIAEAALPVSSSLWHAIRSVRFSRRCTQPGLCSAARPVHSRDTRLDVR